MDKIRLNRISSTILLGLILGACAEIDENDNLPVDDSGYSSEKITSTKDVSTVKDQSIGNCSLYAFASFIETMNKSATQKELDISESYWSFWYWFDQIANGEPKGELETGVNEEIAFKLINRYGMMLERDFIPEEENVQRSLRQNSAYDHMEKWLNTKPFGSFFSPRVGTRARRKIVLNQLKDAWGLNPEVIQKIDAVFGNDVSKTLDRKYIATPPGHTVLRDVDVRVRIPNYAASMRAKSIVFSTNSTVKDLYVGSNAFVEEKYTVHDRKFWQASQRSLHAGVPVLSTWLVDFNARTNRSRFSRASVEQRGPGNQGRHMTIMVDYSATLADGRTFKVGETVTDSNILNNLLCDDTTLLGVMMKNSWGGDPTADRNQEIIPGFVFIEMDYLNGPLKLCKRNRVGGTDVYNCPDTTTGMIDILISPVFYEDFENIH